MKNLILSEKILIGNTFPLPLIRRAVEIRPVSRDEIPINPEVFSFWGHQNTQTLAGQFLGLDLTPRQERPVLNLSEKQLPMLFGEEFWECWIVSPNYVENFRAKIGEEIPAEKIKNWTILKITWLQEESLNK